MADLFFLVPMSVTINASAAGTLTYSVPAGESLEIKGILQQSTGAFDIRDIGDSAGRDYSSASPSVPLDGNFFSDIASNNNGIYMLPVPIVLQGGISITFDLVDTSAAQNTIDITLVCRRIVPN